MKANQPTTAATTAMLERVVRQIVAECTPRKIVLFGSQAYGTPSSDSDIDLFVIVETAERPVEVAARLAATVDHPMALDILVRTPDEVARRLAAHDSFVTDVMSRGIVLYEAGD